LAGAGNQEAKKFFIDHYLTASLAKKKSQLMHKPPSEVFTVIDEAFAYWILDNQWDVWTDMHKNEKTETSKVKAKYTRPAQEGGSKRFGGWTEQGKTRFNELVDQVCKERSGPVGKAFDVFYVQTRPTVTPNKRQKRKNKPVEPERKVKIANGLAMMRKSAAFDNESSMFARPIVQQEEV